VARNRAVSATSSTVVNSPSTVSFSMTFLMTSCSETPSSFACSGICCRPTEYERSRGRSRWRGRRARRLPWQRPLPSLSGRAWRLHKALEHRSFLRVHRTHVDNSAAALLIHLARWLGRCDVASWRKTARTQYSGHRDRIRACDAGHRHGRRRKYHLLRMLVFFVHSRLYGVSIKAGQFYSWSARSAQIAQTNSNAKPEAPSNTASTLRTSSPVPGCGG
jgi:hypothetical protein